MLSTDEFIKDFLQHVEIIPYDPVKAHDYYLRTRHLKGRATVAAPATSSRRSGTRSVSVVRHPVKAVPHKTAEQKHKEIEVRVQALNARLEKLKKVLALLVKQAKGRSGVKTPIKAIHNKSTVTTGTVHLTAKQKADKAKASKAFYEKHKNDATDANVQSIEAKIKEVSDKIVKMRAELAQAKQQVQNHKPVPVGVGSKLH